MTSTEPMATEDGLTDRTSATDDAAYEEVYAFFRSNAAWSDAAGELVDHRAAALVLREARALDARDYEGWLSLYGPRSIYWIPLYEQVGDPRTEPTIHFDDRRRLGDRVALIRTGYLHAQTPPSITTRVVSSLECRVSDERSADIHSCLVIHEQRLGHRQVYAGRQIHRLERIADEWKILYRVLCLVDRDVSQGNITFIL